MQNNEAQALTQHQHGMQGGPAMMPAPVAMFDRDTVDSKHNEMPNIGAAMWRYRWAVALPTMLGMLTGFLIFLRTPETFRSTTQIMVESDRPAVMDTMTGEMVGGAPSIDIVQSELFSDWVINSAYRDPRMANYRDDIEGGFEGFVRMVKSDEALELEPIVTDVKTAQSVVALIHFDSSDEDLSEAAVKSFADSLQEFYNQKYSATQVEVEKFIRQATKEIAPDIEELLARQMQFRLDEELDFDQENNLVNPHRVNLNRLREDRAELLTRYNEAAIDLASIKQTAEASKDPVTALAVVSQFLGRDFNLPQLDRAPTFGAGTDDDELAAIEAREQLIPLQANRDSLVAQFGKLHPQVAVLNSQIESLTERLQELGRDRSTRITALMDDAERKKEQARDAVSAVIEAAAQKKKGIETQLREVLKQIQDETKMARNLANKEMEFLTIQDELSVKKDLLHQVGESLSRVKMSKASDSETRVRQLVEAKGAYLVAPIIWKLVGIGGFLGLALGAGLAFLLEKNANTFRDPDEISATLGVPVLTHVPFFKKRSKRSKDGKDAPYADLDPCLAVLHSPSSVVAESIRSLRTSVFFETGGETGSIIQLTSPLPGDGKSTLAGNLACAIAQSGKSVLAIDCDLRRPQFTDNFLLQDKLGLTNVLNGEAEWHEACHTTPLTHLDVMPSGPIPANPAEALTLPEMAEMLDELRLHYDYIIIDTPPLLVVTDPSILASMVDGVVLAVRVRRKSKLNAKEAVNILRAVGGRCLGCIINNSDEASSSDGYRGYGYYRYSRYAKKYYRRGTKTGGEVLPRGSKKRSGMVVGGRAMPAEGRPVSPAAIRAQKVEVASDAAQPAAPTVPDTSLNSDR